MDASSAHMGDLVSAGRATDPAVKEHAYRCWLEYGRSWRLTSAKTGIAERTLHNWADKDGWQERRAKDAAAVMPGAMAESAFALRLAAHNAAIRLQQIAYEALESGTAPDSKEVAALRSIVELGGVALGKLSPDAAAAVDRAKETAQTSGQSAGVVKLSPEDRDRLAAKLLPSAVIDAE